MCGNGHSTVLSPILQCFSKVQQSDTLCPLIDCIKFHETHYEIFHITFPVKDGSSILGMCWSRLVESDHSCNQVSLHTCIIDSIRTPGLTLLGHLGVSHIAYGSQGLSTSSISGSIVATYTPKLCEQLSRGSLSFAEKTPLTTRVAQTPRVV